MHRGSPVIKSIVILLALTQALYAETGNWVLLKQINDNSALFYDNKEIQIVETPEKRILAWILLKNQQDEVQTKAQVLFDCLRETAIIKSVFEYNKKGDVIYHWTEVLELDLVDGKVARFFCSRYP
jgi:hypothetical protein